MKKISVILPTYNEEDNVIPLSKEIVNIFNNELNNYDYEIIFTDNNSIDSTREKIISLCQENKNIKAIIIKSLYIDLMTSSMLETKSFNLNWFSGNL